MSKPDGTRITLSPLAERIYHTLVRQVRSPSPLISYGDLVRAVGPLPPPDADLTANDQRLFKALAEIARACRSNKPPLPILPSIVVRRTEDGNLGMPGAGYFTLVFPSVRDETTKGDRWREEVKRVLAIPYPEQLTLQETPRRTGQRIVPSWLHEPAVIAAIIGLVGTLLTVVVTVWISGRRDERPKQNQPDHPVASTIPTSVEPSRPRQSEPPEEKSVPQKLTLDEILEVLERHHQRATFGAVSGILDVETESLFNGYTRTQRTSWVVNKNTGLPTGTKPEDYPPGLLQNKHVIDTPDDLRVWLRDHH